MEQRITVDMCWCGSRDLEAFSKGYNKCMKCFTLVRSSRMPDKYYEMGKDGSFYGNDYWTKYIKEEYGHDIYQHARDYLSERCIYWLRDILRYRLPPSRTMEFGCGHGGLVFLMHLAGYDAAGADLSQWICDFGKKTFDIPVMRASINDFKEPSHLYNMIILMDVLEHLPSPVESFRKIASLLSDDGIVVIQTPCMKHSDMSLEDLKSANDLFLKHLEPEEHLFLFNREAITLLFKETGFNHVSFEEAIFPYDTFAVGGKQSLRSNERESIESCLLKSPLSRIILSLIEIFEKEEAKERVLRDCEADREERLKALNKAAKIQKDLKLNIEAQHEDINRLRSRIEFLDNEIASLKASLSWKITKPLRQILGLIKMT